MFISYSRTDIASARQLRDNLLAVGLAVWHDLKDIGAGQWWSQIEDAIVGRNSVEHVVLIVSPIALASKIVEREWKIARREGKTVSTVIPPQYKDSIDFKNLAGWMRAEHFYDLAQPEQLNKFIDVLKKPGQQPKRPMMAPPLPEGCVQRSAEFARLKSALLAAEGAAVAITAALRGAGGFGKTVLATALARDGEIQDTFFDGVLWITLGQTPSLLRIISDLIFALTEERKTFTEISIAVNRLKELLEYRNCLLIIDDVWQQGHLRPFLDGAVQTVRLITTRRDDILPHGIVKVVVDAMTSAESVALLQHGFVDTDDQQIAELAKLAADRLGNWPILLALVNGFLHARVARGEPLTQAIARVNERLDRRGLAAFDQTLESERTAAIDKTVGVGLDLLAEFDKGARPKGYHAQRYSELAVFPEDVEVPIATIARLWSAIVDIDDLQTEELLERLYGLAFLQALDLKRRTVRLHDVMRKYLFDRVGPDTVRVLHRQVVAAYRNVKGGDFSSLEERRYFYEQMAMHLHEAGERAALDSILLDPERMQEKLDALDSPMPLVADYARFANGPAQDLIGRTLLLSAGILSKDRRQLIPQLLGRLSDEDDGALAEFLLRAKKFIQAPALVPAYASLTNPGAEIARLIGHEKGRITGLHVAPAAKIIASASKNSMDQIRNMGYGNPPANLLVLTWVLAQYE